MVVASVAEWQESPPAATHLTTAVRMRTARSRYGDFMLIRDLPHSGFRGLWWLHFLGLGVRGAMASNREGSSGDMVSYLLN